MKKPTRHIILLLLILQALPSPAQQHILWQRHFGGSLDDRADVMISTKDTGFVLFGYSSSSNYDLTNNKGAYDYWLVKTDDAGLLLWQQNYGGAGLDEGRDVFQCSDGGYLLICSTSSNNADVSNNYGNYDYWVVKTNSLGVIEWERNLGGTSNDRAWAGTQTADGHFAIIGYAYSDNVDVSNSNGSSDYWLVKLSSDGNILWEKNFGGDQPDPIRTFQETADGGFILAGYTESDDGDVSGNYGQEDFWLVKTDNAGTLLWEQHFGGSKEEIARIVRQTSDGGYMLGGTSSSNDNDLTDNKGGKDAWIFKLNAAGDLQWQRNYGGSGTEDIRDIQQCTDGGYILVGNSNSSNGNLTENKGGQDGWIIKTDSLGNLLWQKSLGGTQEDLFESVVALPHHTYVIAGYTRSNDGDVEANYGLNDFWMLKIQDCVFPDSIPQL